MVYCKVNNKYYDNIIECRNDLGGEEFARCIARDDFIYLEPKHFNIFRLAKRGFKFTVKDGIIIADDSEVVKKI